MSAPSLPLVSRSVGAGCLRHDHNGSGIVKGILFTSSTFIVLQGAVRPAGMRPHTTPDINDTAADLHDTASVTTDAIRTVDLNDGALTTADVTELRNGDVVLERDDSAERMPTKQKRFFGGGEL